MADDVIYKKPSEILTYSYDFTPKLQGDTTITAASAVTATDESGASASVFGSVTRSGNSLSCPLQAGVDGHDYQVVFTGIGTTTADKRTWTVEMRVRQNLGGVV
jgi:hypothetical protein